MFLRVALPFFLMLLVTSCSNTGTMSSSSSYTYPLGVGYKIPENASTATKEEVDARIQGAEKIVATIPIGYEWRFTGKYIKDAKALAAKGNYSDAYVTASRALFEAETAKQQSIVSQQKWPDFVVK